MTGPVAASLGALVFGAVGGVALRVVAEAGRNARKSDVAVHPARLAHSSAASLAVSVLSDSALGHYRGSFENPGMFAPLISSTLALYAGADGAMNASAARRSFRRWSFALSMGVGVTGLGFHVNNVFRRPGGLTWLNLFYGAPLGAPAALAVSGLAGLAAERISEQKAREPTLFGLSGARSRGDERSRPGGDSDGGGAVSLPGRIPEPLHVGARHIAARCVRSHGESDCRAAGANA